MRKLIVTFIALAILVSTVSIVSPQSDKGVSYKPATYGIPDTIAGYTVLAVKTSENTACMLSGTKRIIVQTSDSDVDEFLRNNNPNAVQQELASLKLATTNWELEYVGPGVVWSEEEFLSQNDEWNSQFRFSECLKFEPLNMQTGTRVSGLGIFQNTDAGLYTNDNAQSINIVVPSTIGTTQNAASTILNNVETAGSSFYFLQNGITFWSSGTAWIVWTDTTHGYQIQQYDVTKISYDPSHPSYWFTITYSNNIWYMCANDNFYLDGSHYWCVSETSAVGNNLKLSTNTSVWIENSNTNSNWYQGFGSPYQLQVKKARIYRNGIGNNWTTEQKLTNGPCGTTWPVNNALSGTLTYGGNGYFLLPGVPLACFTP